MSTTEYARRLVDRPLGRIELLLVGVAIIAVAVVLYLPIGPVLWGHFPPYSFS